MSPPKVTIPNLKGKVVLVTGSTGGVGYEIVRQLSLLDARIYLCARSEKKGKAVMASLKLSQPNADLHLLLLDHSSLPSMVAGAQKFLASEKRLDVLYANAGIMATPSQIFDSGYEAELQVNYISHFLLTYLLLPLMVETARSAPTGSVRVINTTSVGHDHYAPKIGIDFDDMNQIHGPRPGRFTRGSRYGMSKLANILHAKEISRRYRDKGIWTAAVHPGAIQTDLFSRAEGMEWAQSSAFKAFGKLVGIWISVEEAGLGMVYAGVGLVEGEETPFYPSGSYLCPVGKISKPSKNAEDVDMARKLWEWTETEIKKKKCIT